SPACAMRGDFITKEVSLFGKTVRSFETMGIGLPLSRTARVNGSATLSDSVTTSTPFANDEDLKEVGINTADPVTHIWNSLSVLPKLKRTLLKASTACRLKVVSSPATIFSGSAILK